MVSLSFIPPLSETPQGPLVRIHPLKGRGSESSSWAKQRTSSPVTGAVIAKPVSRRPRLDPPVPPGLLQWDIKWEGEPM